MTKIVTISREFGSGGRELGKRLADNLGFAYYDREIIDAVARESRLDKNYVESVLQKGNLQNFKLTYGRTLSLSPASAQPAVDILVAERNVIRELAARQDCVIVGRGSDVILREFKPFNVFVYADLPSKIARCRSREPENGRLSDRQLIKEITQIDKARSRHHAFLAGGKWGEKENYHLCVNTTGLDISGLSSVLTQYIKLWPEQRKQ